MKKKYTSTTREWVNTLFWAAIIAIVFRGFLFEPFTIPSGSMIPTLHVGDYIFVTKWSYGYSRYSFPFGSWHLFNGRIFGHAPVRGDVIVFRKPDESVDYVKRLIGMPGDRVQMIGGRLYINGTVVERKNPRPYIIADLPRSVRSVGWIGKTVDGRDMVIRGGQIFVDNAPADFNYTIQYIADSDCATDVVGCRPMPATEWTEVLPGGREHSIVEITDDAPYDNTGVFIVPENNYFMMGDDRDLSADSRVDLGFVPREYLMGRASFIWLSRNWYSPFLFVWDWARSMRWSRFGMGVK